VNGFLNFFLLYFSSFPPFVHVDDGHCAYFKLEAKENTSGFFFRWEMSRK